MGDDEPRRIIGKGDVKINLPDGAIWKFREVRHVLCLKRNLISVGQLAHSRCETTFLSDSWMVTKGATVLAREKKEGNLYETKNKRYVVTKIAGRSKGSKLQWCKIGRECEEGMKVLRYEEKHGGLKSCYVNFCKVRSFGKQRWNRFSKKGRILKAGKRWCA